MTRLTPRPTLIPLALLRDLAAVVLDPMRPAQFVDLAEMMAGRGKPVASLPPAAVVATASQVSATTDKKGLPWTVEELESARAMLNAHHRARTTQGSLPTEG